jgi:hypothetical protein
MSEKREVENAPALEDIFLSREFGKHVTRHAPGPHREFERAHTAKPQHAVALEDLLRTQEFGRTAVAAPADDVLFAPVPPRPLTPMSPLVAYSGHDTTTHRRNRFVATASGVAAALLLAVGLATTTTGKAPGSKGTVAIGGTVKPSPPSPLTGNAGFDGNLPTGPGPVGLASGTPSSSGISTAAFTTGGTSNGSGSSGSGNGSTGSGGTGTGKGGGSGGGGTGTTPPTSSSGSILTPVVSIVGHVVVSTGALVTATSTGLGNTLPPITPVTNLLGGVGGTVAGLGWGIVKIA